MWKGELCLKSPPGESSVREPQLASQPSALVSSSLQNRRFDRQATSRLVVPPPSIPVVGGSRGCISGRSRRAAAARLPHSTSPITSHESRFHSLSFAGSTLLRRTPKARETLTDSPTMHADDSCVLLAP